QKHLEGNALDPWILALKEGVNDLRGARLKISSFYLYKDIYLQNARSISHLFYLTKGGEEKQIARAYGFTLSLIT
ncbi:hypothetical protein Tco_1076791, partial [Tanacetum coccineum]